MKIREVMEISESKLLTGEEFLDEEVTSAFASDLMSDVLAYAKDCSMLMTGLANAQAIRTADMLDIHCVLFVRGKMPDEQMINLAKDKGMIVLQTPCYMFTTCGRLFEAGLIGGAI